MILLQTSKQISFSWLSSFTKSLEKEKPMLSCTKRWNLYQISPKSLGSVNIQRLFSPYISHILFHFHLYLWTLDRAQKCKNPGLQLEKCHELFRLSSLLSSAPTKDRLRPVSDERKLDLSKNRSEKAFHQSQIWPALQIRAWGSMQGQEKMYWDRSKTCRFSGCESLTWAPTLILNDEAKSEL